MNAEQIQLIKDWYNDPTTTKKEKVLLEKLYPYVKENEDERIRKHIIKILDNLAPCHWDGNEKAKCIAYLEKQKVYVNDLSPEQETYLLSERFKQAEKEKDEFTARRFLKCLASFDKFRKGEYYWLEYVGGDMYVGRSDNVLGGKFHITPKQLFSLFSVQFKEISESQQDKQKPIISAEESLDISQEEYNKIVDECIYGEQKEQEPINECNTHEPTLDEARKWNKAYENGYSLGYENGKNEQKPAEWSWEDVEHLNSIIEKIEGICRSQFVSTRFAYSEDMDWLKSLTKRFNLQPKQEWSEVDKATLDSIIAVVEEWEDEQSEEEKEYYGERQKSDFLKSLPERFNLQLKQEWSEDAKKTLDEISDYLEYRGREEDADFIRHLRPQPHWKPSEGQMSYLLAVLNDPNNAGSESCHLVLKKLYDDLKKL